MSKNINIPEIAQAAAKLADTMKKQDGGIQCARLALQRISNNAVHAQSCIEGECATECPTVIARNAIKAIDDIFRKKAAPFIIPKGFGI